MRAAARRRAPPDCGVTVTPGPAGATQERVAAVLADRDAIQANLLELDGNYARQALEGAALTGLTRQRWEKASAALASLWETFLAYSAVVDRIALLGGARKPSKNDQAELAALLTEGCVQLSGPNVPLAQRDLTATARPPVTLVTAVGTMRRAFAEVTEVTSAVEAVWAAVGAPLDAATEELARDRPLVAGLGADLESAFAEAESAVNAARAASNADPLALWQGGRADTSAADRARGQVAALTPRIAELARLRDQAQRRIAGLATATAVARGARTDAVTAWREAATRITVLPPLPPDVPEPPVAALGALATGGQWSRLAAELDRCEADLARSGEQTDGVRKAAAAAIDKRDELRALLRAYKAKAGRLGAAEESRVAARYDEAYALLWTAPCDLAAAEPAVVAYQRAILEGDGRR
ncbi:MAG TPA: hypothetical protein VMI73_18795 [Trebonia sp.]|nr:hypothetical protein [Trebonia sp.]